MARPKPDITAVKSNLLDAAEALLAQHGSEKVTVTDVAARCNMSQSNAYRFFPDKSALMAGVAERWFAEFEDVLTKIAAEKCDAETKLYKFLLTQQKLKRARYDADPELFLAYLKLAQGNMATVWFHVNKMSTLLLTIVSEWLSENGCDVEQAKPARDAIEDATLLFRDPNIIARRRNECTDQRAKIVIDNMLCGFRHTMRKKIL